MRLLTKKRVAERYAIHPNSVDRLGVADDEKSISGVDAFWACCL